MHSWRIKISALLAIFGGLAAGLVAWYAVRPPKDEPPPISLSYRVSKIPGQGMVMGITNHSDNEPLTGVQVSITFPNEGAERTYVVKKQPGPRDSIAVGWVELDGWKLKRGDKVAVRCRSYTQAIEDEVPER
jgi:hypothetical protein